MTSEKIRTAVLFHRLGPYHHARLNAAGQMLAVWGLETCAMDNTYAWHKVDGAAGFNRVTLTDRDTGDRRWKREMHREMWRRLDEIRPQVVAVPGWASCGAMSALAWSAANHIPVVVMSESTAWDVRRDGWKEWVKSQLVKSCRAGLVGGTPHAEYLAKLGLPPERIFAGYDTVDNEHFAGAAAESRKQKTESQRKYGLPEQYFLASARFVEKKNLFRLMEAFALYRATMKTAKSEGRKVEEWDLVLLGDGPLKADLCQLISDLGLQNSVLLPGFKQYDELPVYFGLARAFVHASTIEQWGLVVNEAMACGLPVLVSNRCGCAQDLVKEGRNGFTFDPLNVEELAALMQKVSGLNSQLPHFGAASREIISGWGPERFAMGLKQAVEAALRLSPPKAGLVDRALLRFLLFR